MTIGGATRLVGLIGDPVDHSLSPLMQNAAFAAVALLLAIGTGQTALWVALPLAIAVAAYAPGTAPFAMGQAAFTITVVVLFNLLVPAGWKVGLLRIEDVAIGCAVSLVIGVPLKTEPGASGMTSGPSS